MAWESPLQRGSKSYSHKRRNARFKGLRRVHTPPQPPTVHTTAHTAKHGAFSRPQRGFVLSAKLSPKEQPEKVDARLMACVRFLRRRGPAGLRSSSVHLQNRQDPLQSLLYYGTIGLPVNG